MSHQNQELVIITGHTSGLGHALLQRALKEGSYVIGLARRNLSLPYPRLQELSCDLSVTDLDVDDLLLALTSLCSSQKWTKVTLINNAGSMHPVGLLGQLSPREISASLMLNAIWPLQLCNWLVRMFPDQSLRLAHISSGAAKKPYEGWASYCVAKSGLRMLAQVFAGEAANSGADRLVIVYEPGVLDSPMQTELRDLNRAQFPAVERFRQMHATGQLVALESSAHQLWDLLSSEHLAPYFETRYAPS